MKKQTIAIIGAGPAGLTAAYELSKNENYRVVVLESSAQVGGISRTINFKGNLIDIGGHRFFSKSEKVLSWWASILPIVDTTNEKKINYHNQQASLQGFVIQSAANSFLIRNRKSRIFFEKKMFDYPLRMTPQLIINLGLLRSLRIFRDILWARVFPIKNEKTLEDFYINRFGKTLYNTFFKEYSVKVWGKPCSEISNAWGKQRVKGLKIRELFWHSIKKVLLPERLRNLKSRTLTETFLYPAKGPGMLWEVVAKLAVERQVEILFNTEVTSVYTHNNVAHSVEYLSNGAKKSIEVDAVFSTMPISTLTTCLSGDNTPPKAVFEIAKGLEYRDFLIVGLLVSRLKFKKENGKMITDNWLYIQDSGVQVGRLQLFNNWSPFMTSKDFCWIGAEYFCAKGDAIWEKTESEMIALAVQELATIGILDPNAFIDGTVVKVPKAYPSYTGTYHQLAAIESYLDGITNIYPIGRNGMHKYNNQDHSMLTAFRAVELFANPESGHKSELWKINADDEYQEEIKK
ncbi:MAG: NAD(P)/FAD-dependent oxidoreductase [Schleiferiaceae bacterium]|nr:NAD(P)/FAD-dependent oxidoreductase [Schleiferiaceae bacterium]